jgi:hypothetical protein
VSIHIRVSGLAHRRTLLPLTMVALVGFFCSNMMAQTAPQLLPYSVKVIAGGGTTTLPLATPLVPGSCTPSGYTPTTIWGDGCLATDLVLSATSGVRTAVTDAYGNIFFADYINGLIRRVDAASGIVTTVAGGVAYTASPGAGAACATGASTMATDAKGDGCLGTQVYVAGPVGLVFSPAGDLYFSEVGSSSMATAAKAIFGADVRKIAATYVAEGTGGCAVTAGCQMVATTGVISMVDGALSSYTTVGYTANNYSASPACSATNLTNCIVAATQSYLGDPYGLAFDSYGNIYISEEYENAILVVNTSASTNSVSGVTIPSGTVAKIAGYSTIAGDGSTCPNGYKGESGSPKYGCNYSIFTTGSLANSSEIDAPYGVAVDSSKNVYFANEYYNDIGLVASTNVLTNYAGLYPLASAGGTTLQRGTAGTFAIGSTAGIVADSNTPSNIYVTDALNGVIWRVDGAGQHMYVVAGGVGDTGGTASICSASIVPGVTVDSYGDGCAATSTRFGKSGTKYATSSSPGIFGVSVDSNSDLFVGDTLTGLVREVASGTRFSPISDTLNPSANQATQYIKIHFAANDTESSFTLTDGTANFSLGTADCATNSDKTRDCVLPITATPSELGLFTGTLQVTATGGGSASFPLSGTFVNSPQTRTVVSAGQAINCASTTTYSTTAQVTLTATITSSGPVSNGSTVTFYANGNQIGTPQTVDNNVAALPYTFSTPGNYAITAVFSGDGFYETSTSLPFNIASAAPSLGATVNTAQQNTVSPGQTALYSFSLLENVYSGTITFSCSGLPAGSSCVFSPASISATGCQASSTIALSILTQQPLQAASLGGAGRGPWRELGIFLSVGLALLIGIRRRSISLRCGRIWMALVLLLATVGIMSCNSSVSQKTTATPAGTYSVSVTATGSGGVTYSFTVPLTVQ